MSKAHELLEILIKKSYQDGLNINAAKQIVLAHPDQYDTDFTQDEEGKESHHYIFNDESTLIIDDEGYIYEKDDDEISIICRVE